MIERIDIDGVHTEVSAELRKYVGKRIGRLDRYVPRHIRSSMRAEIKLKEGPSKNEAERTCEVILHLPQELLRVEETTINMFAAVDIVERRLQNLLKKYKEQHTNPRLHQRLIARLKHRVSD